MEFGGTYDPLGSGQLAGEPKVFASGTGALGAGATSVPVPVGQTWVLGGVDWYAQTSGNTGVHFTLVGPAGAIIWSASEQAVSPDGLLNGITWRGACPYASGAIIQASTFSDAFPVAFGVQCWGWVLPYDIG